MNAPRPTPEYKRVALDAIRKAIPGTQNKAQCERIRTALAQFGITTFEAMRYLDVYDPRARVMQLRNDGAPIQTLWETILTESGDRHRVGLYVMGVTP
jgi:hypothetical protein